MPVKFRAGVITGARASIKAPKRDGRKFKAERARMAQIIADKGNVSELSLIATDRVERYVFVTHHTRRMEAAALAGQPFDVNKYLSFLNAELRLGELIGAKRHARKVESLADVMRQLQGRTEAAPAPAASHAEPTPVPARGGPGAAEGAEGAT